MKNKLRIFIAIELPDSLKKEINSLTESFKGIHAPVRWVPVKNIHLTLKFLGEITENQLETAKEVSKRVAPNYTSFSIQPKGCGAFPNLRRPRVFWVGLEEPKELLNLQKEIEDTLAKEGFPVEERKFSPHLTIGRAKGTKNIEKLAEKIEKLDFVSEPFLVNSFVIIESKLFSTGALYTVVERLSLNC